MPLACACCQPGHCTAVHLAAPAQLFCPAGLHAARAPRACAALPHHLTPLACVCVRLPPRAADARTSRGPCGTAWCWLVQAEKEKAARQALERVVMRRSPSPPPRWVGAYVACSMQHRCMSWQRFRLRAVAWACRAWLACCCLHPCARAVVVRGGSGKGGSCRRLPDATYLFTLAHVCVRVLGAICMLLVLAGWLDPASHIVCVCCRGRSRSRSRSPRDYYRRRSRSR